MGTELEMSEMYPKNENSILKEILPGELLASPKEFNRKFYPYYKML